MIAELRIGNLGVIEEAIIEPHHGLTVVTGETGAGKTMVVTGLGLLLGEKASAGQVRTGVERLQVTGRLSEVSEAAASRVADAGGELDDGELLVVRSVSAAGRSRAHLGGIAVPMKVAGEVIAEHLTIHGQSEQLRLARTERQREVLDQYAGTELAQVLQRYQQAWHQRRAAVTECDTLREASRERARELDLLRFGLDEIQQVAPQPQEDDTLRQEAHRLQSVDELRIASHTALTAVNGDPDDPTDPPSLTAMTAAAADALARGDSDPALADLHGRLTEVGYQLTDLGAELASYLANLESDPQRLEQITARLAALGGLTRKYGDSIDDVLAWAQTSQQRIQELDTSDERIAELESTIAELDAILVTEASRLSDLRRTAANRLAAAVATELTALAMPKAALRFEVQSTGELADLGPWGGDRIEIRFSANPGQAAGPLGAVASGGELSRIRLALEVSLADQRAEDPAGATMVFDEVDAGIGGRVATEVGRRLARLARHSQVIVVTHLAQVAAFADRHYRVAKSSEGQVTTSDVAAVTGDERLSELARMLGGDDSATARAHAAELVEHAASLD